MEVSDYILNEIADNLDTGFRCFLNKKSLELVTYPSDSYVSFEPEMWEAQISTVKKSKKDFIEIESLTSFDSFKIMEEFILTVEDHDLQKRLLNSIHNRKPFAAFKSLIDNLGTERDRWFNFKKQWYIQLVKTQLKFI